MSRTNKQTITKTMTSRKHVDIIGKSKQADNNLDNDCKNVYGYHWKAQTSRQ